MKTPPCVVAAMFSDGHHWENWAIVSRADLKLNDRVVGRATVQERRCLLCGFVQQDARGIWVDDRPVRPLSIWQQVFGHKANEA